MRRAARDNPVLRVHVLGPNPLLPVLLDAGFRIVDRDQYLASERALGCRPEKLLQGPLADALTHVGQIMMLRRLASAPVRSENFAIAEIVAGRVSEDQAAPRFEFD